MRMPRIVATGTMLLVIAGCAGSDALAPGDHRAPLADADGGATQVSGAFDAIVDFTTLRLTPRGSNCLLDVDGRLVFHGGIEGTGIGHTTALVFATCEEVASLPPGTDPDVFHSRFSFTGTVNGEPATAKGLYHGRVQPGGHIEGQIIFSNGVSGALDASGQVAVGGTYSGSVVAH